MGILNVVHTVYCLLWTIVRKFFPQIIKFIFVEKIFLSPFHRNKLGTIFRIALMHFRAPQPSSSVQLKAQTARSCKYSYISSGNEECIKFCIWIGRISSMMYAFICSGLFFPFRISIKYRYNVDMCALNFRMNSTMRINATAPQKAFNIILRHIHCCFDIFHYRALPGFIYKWTFLPFRVSFR